MKEVGHSLVQTATALTMELPTPTTAIGCQRRVEKQNGLVTGLYKTVYSYSLCWTKWYLGFTNRIRKCIFSLP